MPFSVTRPLRTLVVAALLALMVAGLGPAAPGGAMPIEGFPSYEPQKTCSPQPKPGTVMLAEHLVSRYKGSGSLGISRSCAVSGVSEHKEGRAFDWRLNAGSLRDRGYADSFLKRILATDKAGHKAALARRMGIMYVIWNDHIWSGYYGYRKRDYLSPGCRKISTCSTTLRHRDHMHISLTRAAARGETSWYLRRSRPRPTPTPSPTPSPTPAPEPEPGAADPLPKPPPGVIDLREEPYRKITVPSSGATRETSWKLQGGVTYSLTAAGLYSYDGPRRVADSVCVWSSRDRTWKPGALTRNGLRRHALVVNGRQRLGTTCRRSHTYRTTFTPSSDQTLKVRVVAPSRNPRGRLTLVVGRERAKVAPALPTYPDLTPAPVPAAARSGYGLLSETVQVPASTASGAYTVGSLDPGATYRISVSGVVRLGGGVRSDGQCVEVGDTWYRSASIDRRFPDEDHGNLYVNGVPFDGRSTGGCDVHANTADYSPDAAGRLRLQLWDPHDAADNTGDLTVQVQRVTALRTPVPAATERPRLRRDEWTQRRDSLTLAAATRSRVTGMRLRRGETVRLNVQGRFSSQGYAADASCVRTSAGWGLGLPDLLPDLLAQDPLALRVDGQPVSWRAVGTTAGCSSEHTYTTRFTATKSGPLRIGLLDVDHRDNEGELEVSLVRRTS